MVKEKYFRMGDMVSSIIVPDKPGDLVREGIYRHRGMKYIPKEYGGDGDWIADTRINLVFPKDGDLKKLKEVSEFDYQDVPGHKLEKTSYFVVERLGSRGKKEIVVSGWLVPYSSQKGIPMENREGRKGPRDQGYDWSEYMKGNDEYLQKNDLGEINWNDAVEIGRFCKSLSCDGIEGEIAVGLAFRTLHKFLDECGINNYFDAAMNERKFININGSSTRRQYASLYERIGMRKVELYPCDTVVGIRKNEKGDLWEPVLKPVTYFAQHVNVPHIEQRASSHDFGKKKVEKIQLDGREIFVNPANLNKRILQFVAPYTFTGNGDMKKLKMQTKLSNVLSEGKRLHFIKAAKYLVKKTDLWERESGK